MFEPMPFCCRTTDIHRLGLVLFLPSHAALIQLCEMLFLTVPGGTASLQRGLFMGSPGMYFRGFVKGGGIKKRDGGGVLGSCWADVESPRGFSSCQYFNFVRTNLGFNLQSEDIFAQWWNFWPVFTSARNQSGTLGLGRRFKLPGEVCVLCMSFWLMKRVNVMHFTECIQPQCVTPFSHHFLKRH